MKISPTAIDALTTLEGSSWRAEQEQKAAGPKSPAHSFYAALHRFNHGEGTSTIYGAGGVARYVVHADGEIILDGSSVPVQQRNRARLLGIGVTEPADYTEMARREIQEVGFRREDMQRLCAALIRDVCTFASIPEPASELVGNVGLQSLMASRITGWASARLGIVKSEMMSEHASAAVARAQSDGVFSMTGDVFLRLGET